MSIADTFHLPDELRILLQNPATNPLESPSEIFQDGFSEMNISPDKGKDLENENQS